MNSGYNTNTKKFSILVLGYIIRGPMGGMTWHYLQYFLGLHQLGHDVYFLEDSGDTEYACYDPERNITDSNPSYGLKYASLVFKQLGLDQRWAYYDQHTQMWLGPIQNSVKEIIGRADMLLNISASNPIRPWFAKVPVRVLIDTDPVFTQIRNLSNASRFELCKQHNAFFTFGENFGKPKCTIPDDGFPWLPTRQPICTSVWKVSSCKPRSNWTTLMQWQSYSHKEYGGIFYGVKSHSFTPFLALPKFLTSEKIELGLAISEAQKDEMEKMGWIITNPSQTSKSIGAYQNFIADSKGEWTVAKHGYVISNSGWFSERTLNYMASGKPVVTQSTGFDDFLPVGKGVFAFSTLEEAIEEIKKVNKEYKFHCLQARKVVEEFFDARTVLSKLLAPIT